MSTTTGAKALYGQIGAVGNETANIRLQTAEEAIIAVSVRTETRTKTFIQPDMPIDGAEGVGTLIIGDKWVDTDDNNKLYGWTSEGWQPISDDRFGVLNRVFVQAAQPTADPLFPFNPNDLWFDSDDGFKQYRWNGTAWVTVSDTRIAANATAINSLNSSVSVINGQITAQASQITSLQSSVNTNAAAITTEATTRANQDSALSSSISTVSTTVAGHTATITSQQTSIDGLTLRAFLKLDANGKVVGYEVNNNGVTSNFIITADNFKVVSADGLTDIINAQTFGTSGFVGSQVPFRWTFSTSETAAIDPGTITVAAIRTSNALTDAQIFCSDSGGLSFRSVAFASVQVGEKGGVYGFFNGSGTFLFGVSGGAPAFGSNTIWHAGNFTPSSKADLASPTFTGTVNMQSTVQRGNANSPTTMTAQPRVFVQSADPGAAAADGDLWFW